MSLVTRVKVSVDANYQTAGDLSTPTQEVLLNKIVDLLNGTGAGNANKVYCKKRTLAGSGSESLDLNGVLTDIFGAVLSFTKIRVLCILADAGNADNVLVGGAASNAFIGVVNDATDIIVVPPGGLFLWVAPGAGATVTPSTGDLLKVADSGSGGVTYTIIAIGE